MTRTITQDRAKTLYREFCSQDTIRPMKSTMTASEAAEVSFYVSSGRMYNIGAGLAAMAGHETHVDDRGYVRAGRKDAWIGGGQRWR